LLIITDHPDLIHRYSMDTLGDLQVARMRVNTPHQPPILVISPGLF
jgi:hypothetical protein